MSAAKPPAGSIVKPPSDARFELNKDRHASLVMAATGRRKYQPDDRIDGIIREAYRRLVEENDRRATKWAQRETGWPKFMVTRRAAALGLARVKEPAWSHDELLILETYAHLGVDAIRRKLAAAGFHRTRNGIVLKRKRLQLTTGHLDGYTGTALAELFGLDSHNVYRWIERGLLAATRRETARSERQGGDGYWIRREDVRNFLFAHPDEWDLRKVEKYWFLSVLTEGKISR